MIAFSDQAEVIPNSRGFRLRDDIAESMMMGGTDTRRAIELAKAQNPDRIIVITDEQSSTRISGPGDGVKGYIVNVAPYKNGIGYGQWTHIDGWSDRVLDFIKMYEDTQQ